MNNQAVSTETISRFLDEFRAHVDSCRNRIADELSEFLVEFGNHLASEPAEDRFNILDLMGVGSDEVRHSSILAWLITPNAGHGCRDLFLRGFLEAAGLTDLASDLQGCFVRTEFSVQESIVDIVIGKTGGFLIYVENKTVSSEGVEQVDREYRDLQRLGASLRIPDNRRFAVFLTPQGRKPISGDPRPWLTLAYYDLAEVFAGKRDLVGHAKTRYVVDDLLNIYRGWR